MELNDFEKEFRKETNYNKKLDWAIESNDFLYVEEFKEKMENLRQLKLKNSSKYYAALEKERQRTEQKKLAIQKRKAAALRKKQSEQEQKYKRADSQIKKLASALKENNVLLENITANFVAISEKIAENIAVPTFDNAVEHLVRINIIDALNLPIALCENFNCKIIQGNIASINAKDGIYRYFTRSADNKSKYYFDIITLFQIIYNANYYQAIDKLCKLAKIEVLESGWADAQKIKYADNITIIENAEKEISVRYPILYKYIKKHLYLFVSFYKIPLMDTALLIETEKRAIKLKKAKVSALQINTNNLAKILGQEIFKAVYQDTIFLTNIIKETKGSRKYEYQEREKSKNGNDDFADLPF